MIAFLLGATILGFGLYFLSLFFQLNRIDQKIDDALKDVEVFMLKEFGEISPDSILKNSENESSNESSKS